MLRLLWGRCLPFGEGGLAIHDGRLGTLHVS